MMIKQFVYIDSSEEQENQQFLKPASKRRKHQQKKGAKSNKTSPNRRNCLAHNSETHLVSTTPYQVLVKNLLSEKISEQMKNQLITNIEDVEVATNINKRNLNYEYFMKRMEIDQKYRAIQQQKADRIKELNEDKKKVLYKHLSEAQMKYEELELKKLIVQRKQKQEKVVEHLKKDVRKLGFERIYNAHKKMKQQLAKKQQRQENELASKVNKQRNEILQLQEQYEAIREAKRVNKLQQRKAIKDLSEKAQAEKVGLNEKLRKKKTFEI